MNKRSIKKIIIVSYGIALIFSWTFMVKSSIEKDKLVAMCLSSQFPSAELEATSKVAETTASDEKDNKGETKETEDKEKAPGKPKVLIVHTHATESYLPSSSGNYHTTNEKNSVRDAGNVMAETLEKEGIGVIHNKTLHDNPSYDGSYSRSYDTILEIRRKYPTIECIIDLHRDATAAHIDGPTENVNGKVCAVYSYVISNGTKTYGANKAFVERLNAIADKSFNGFRGEVLERPYWYNQEICGKSVLIELGNNRNNISEVRESAKIFAKILAKALQ